MYAPSLALQSTPVLKFGGAIAAGGTAQTILPIDWQRYYLALQNTSDTLMRVGIGGPTATAALTSGVVTTVTAVNAGMSYSYAPKVVFVGGGYSTLPNLASPGTPWSEGAGGGLGPFQGPTRAASARCVMTGSAGALTISSIAIDDGGAGYIAAPYVYIQNDPRDPIGCFAPSATVGWELAAKTAGAQDSQLIFENVACPTDAISIFCATTGKTFECNVLSRSVS